MTTSLRPAGEMTVQEGIIGGLQRTNHVSGGGGDSPTSTTHLTFFTLGEIRVEYRSHLPPPIADGDQVRVAGRYDNGMFQALACRNLTTSWLSPEPRSGCLIAALVGFILFASVAIAVFALFSVGITTVVIGKFGLLSLLVVPFAALIPGAAIWLLCRTVRASNQATAARGLLLS